MTEKELRKLKRGDFLQLLLAQGKDMAALQARLDEALELLEHAQAANEDLKAELDERDGRIEKIKSRLDVKDATIRALRQEIEDLMASMPVDPEGRRPAEPGKSDPKRNPPQPSRPSALGSKLVQAIKPEQTPKK